MPAKRNYRREYDKYQGTSAQKKRRAKRNAARRKNKSCKGDIDHKDGNPNNNKKSNLRCVSKSKNRSFKRTKTGRKAKK